MRCSKERSLAVALMFCEAPPLPFVHNCNELETVGHLASDCDDGDCERQHSC